MKINLGDWLFAQLTKLAAVLFPPPVCVAGTLEIMEITATAVPGSKVELLKFDLTFRGSPIGVMEIHTPHPDRSGVLFVIYTDNGELPTEGGMFVDSDGIFADESDADIFARILRDRIAALPASFDQPAG